MAAPDRRPNVWREAIPTAPGSIGLARRHLSEQLRAWGWDNDRAGDLVLILSELLTNAITHAGVPGRDVHVRLQEIDGDCRLKVTDSRPDLLPHMGPAGESDEHGRGLSLVKCLATDMDVATSKGRKTVWARVLLGSKESGAAA